MKPGERSEPGDVPSFPDGRVAIVSARFYPELADWLEDGARRALDACGVGAERRVFASVPGCFELPLAASRLNGLERVDAVVALGVVIRGETPHFDYVAGECARGIMAVQLATGVPVGFGVLTTDTTAQAQERADPARGDKGFSATIAALSVAAIGVPPPRSTLGFRR